MAIVFIGCEKKEKTPFTWDVELSDKWNIYGSGEIQKFHIVRGEWCDRSSPCPSDCISHGSYRIIEFKEGTTVSIKEIKDPGLIKIGSIGKLYKYNTGRQNKDSLFRWIEDEEIIEPSKPIAESSNCAIKTEIKYIEKSTTEKYEWKKSKDTEDLKANEFVLIKLDNDIITIGFVTYDKKWKLSLNIGKYEYGETLNNVFQWKQIDLEKK